MKIEAGNEPAPLKIKARMLLVRELIEAIPNLQPKKETLAT
jgi:hypothetical protein